MRWWRRINCCYSWCQGIHQIDSNLASYWEYMLVKYGVYIYIYIYIYVWCVFVYICGFYIVYIYCCRVFLMSRINHYQALTGVHPSLIGPVWARFNISKHGMDLCSLESIYWFVYITRYTVPYSTEATTMWINWPISLLTKLSAQALRD